LGRIEEERDEKIQIFRSMKSWASSQARRAMAAHGVLLEERPLPGVVVLTMNR